MIKSTQEMYISGINIKYVLLILVIVIGQKGMPRLKELKRNGLCHSMIEKKVFCMIEYDCYMEYSTIHVFIYVKP